MTPSINPQTVQLGPTGPVVPALGIGTWSWGDSLFWQYGNGYGEDDVQYAFNAALTTGINFFDTAEIYGSGKSEQLLGQCMQSTDQSVWVATKYFPLPWRLTASAVADAVTASLDRLQVDSIELYQVHQPFSFLMSQKTLMNALADEVEKGRIQTVGVSNYSEAQMRQAHRYLGDRGIPLAVNQMQYSLLHRNIEFNGVLATAKELGITILAYSPLAQGLLTGKYSAEAETVPTGARRISPKFKASYLRKIAPLLKALDEIGEAHGKTMSQVALNWLICQNNVIPIPGAKNAQQAVENAGALGWTLTKDEVELLANIQVQ